MLLRTLFVAISLSLLSCGGGSSSDQLRQDLSDNRALWLGSGIDSYNYTTRTSCFCPEFITLEKRITVVDNLVSEAFYTGDLRQLAQVELEELRTVDEWFSLIEELINDDPSAMFVFYDTEFGYPLQISSDGSSGIADDEIEYILSDLVPVL